MKVDEEIYSLCLTWLCDLKKKIIESKGEPFKLDSGYLCCCNYVDRVIKTLITQQTAIAELRDQLEIERGYSSAWGDFFGYTPQELRQDELEDLRAHMKVFSDKWKKKFEEFEEKMGKTNEAD